MRYSIVLGGNKFLPIISKSPILSSTNHRYLFSVNYYLHSFQPCFIFPNFYLRYGPHISIPIFPQSHMYIKSVSSSFWAKTPGRCVMGLEGAIVSKQSGAFRGYPTASPEFLLHPLQYLAITRNACCHLMGSQVHCYICYECCVILT